MAQATKSKDATVEAVRAAGPMRAHGRPAGGLGAVEADEADEAKGALGFGLAVDGDGNGDVSEGAS